MLEKRPVDRRTAKTKAAIRNALAEALKKKDLQKITVQEIVDKADISRVTFYKYYLDVYDLYDHIEKEMMIKMSVIVLELAEGTTEDFFRKLTEYIYDNRITFEMIFSENATNKLRDKLSKLIEGTFKKIYSEKLGVDMDDKEIAYISCYRSNVFISVIQKWIQGGFLESHEDIVKPIAALDAAVERFFSDNKEKLKKPGKTKK